MSDDRLYSFCFEFYYFSTQFMSKTFYYSINTCIFYNIGALHPILKPLTTSSNRIMFFFYI